MANRNRAEQTEKVRSCHRSKLFSFDRCLLTDASSIYENLKILRNVTDNETLTLLASFLEKFHIVVSYRNPCPTEYLSPLSKKHSECNIVRGRYPRKLSTALCQRSYPVLKPLTTRYTNEPTGRRTSLD